MRLPLSVILLFPKRNELWPDENSDLFESLKAGASDVKTITPHDLTDRSECYLAYQQWKEWVKENVSEVVAVSNGSDQFLNRDVKELKRHLGDDKVFLVNPQDFRS